MVGQLSELSDEELLAGLTRACETNRLLAYEPYPWQREFHDIGAFAKERLLIAANGVGKTMTIAAETAMHATGLYPPWWQGVRLEQGGFEIWIGSIDTEMQRIGLQSVLLGPSLDEELGTGMIPLQRISKVNRRQAGIKDIVDEAFIHHASGKRVKLVFKTFEQGDKKWQSGKPKIIVWDEESDPNNAEQTGLFSEMQTRLVRNDGIFFGGRTPLYGMTPLIEHFMESENPSIRWIGASWDDAPHMSEEARSRVMAAYPEHERETRARGVVMMGQGAIFGTSESDFVVDPFKIPDHWARIKGIDFGLAHPAAVASLAWDRDTNTVYVYQVWRGRIKRTLEHIEVINSDGEEWIPVAWPHDGEKRDPKSGEQLASSFRKRCAMLSKSARYKNDVGGAQSQWKIIEDVRDRLASGTLKVFRTCTPWLEEYRSYHTKDGQIIARRDDALKASFYALMMLRFAQSKRLGRPGSNVLSMAPFTTQAK